jgi:hypothetical protein
MITEGYVDPRTIKKLRIFWEPVGHAHQWCIDGIDNTGGYTESCWSYDTFDEAVQSLTEFAKFHCPHLLTTSR